jgi:molecular chaperone HscB
VADPFSLLGIPASFDLDVAQIEARWRELSRTVHPDKHVGGSAADRRQALSKAMDLNAAFRVVKDPIKRALALLELAGASAGEGKEPAPDMELLMSVMQLRGDLATARAAGDVAAIEIAIGEVKALEKAALADTARSLSVLLATPGSDASAAVKNVGKLRYYRRFLEEAEAIVDDVADRAASSVLP